MRFSAGIFGGSGQRSLSAFAYAAWIIAKTLIWGVVTPGFATLMCVVLFLVSGVHGFDPEAQQAPPFRLVKNGANDGASPGPRHARSRLRRPEYFFQKQSHEKCSAKFGGMDVSDAKRLRALESENAKLKKLLAEAHLAINALKSVFGVKR